MRGILICFGILVAQIARLLGIRTDVTSSNIARALPELTAQNQRRILKASYTNLGRVFAEMLYLRFASLGRIATGMRFHNPEVFTRSLGQGKGLVVVAAHLANWEWMALAGPLILGTPLAVVIKNNPVARTERFLQRMRRRTGNAMVNTADVRGMFKTLLQGGCIALLGDQAAPGGSVRVDFFSGKLPFFEGPARLALRTGSPMLFAKCIRNQDGCYILEFIEVNHGDLTGDSEEAVHELTQRHVRILERSIREHPEQWVWQHRRWKNE